MAINKFKADMGMIIVAAEKSSAVENAVLKQSNKIDMPIVVVAGEDVAKFLLKYGNELLFEKYCV